MLYRRTCWYPRIFLNTHEIKQIGNIGKSVVTSITHFTFYDSLCHCLWFILMRCHVNSCILGNLVERFVGVTEGIIMADDRFRPVNFYDGNYAMETVFGVWQRVCICYSVNFLMQIGWTWSNYIVLITYLFIWFHSVLLKLEWVLRNW